MAVSIQARYTTMMFSFRNILLAVLISTVSCTGAYAVPPKRIESRGLLDALVPRKPIDIRKLGVNAFANEPRFGSVKSQLSEVKSRLKVKYIRVLFAWNDQVQASSNAPINYSFYDDIARNIPSGVEALVVLTGLPRWVRTSTDPAASFVSSWVTPTVSRYRNNKKIKAFQIWNEPNDPSNVDNVILNFSDPLKYVAMLSDASASIRTVAPGKLVVNAATTAIAQNYPGTLRYNEKLLDAGITGHIDRFAIHFYGESYHNIILPGGIQDVFSTVNIPIWVTESGRQGAKRQREYIERSWPFLKKYLSKIDRFYYYQFTESGPESKSYGLKYTNGVSELYRYLSSRKRS